MVAIAGHAKFVKRAAARTNVSISVTIIVIMLACIRPASVICRYESKLSAVVAALK